jgi:hypothetical protein
MRKGTLACMLVGHKFHAERVEYEPHYKKLVKNGQVAFLTKGDYHLVGFTTEYCIRCGKRDI